MICNSNSTSVDIQQACDIGKRAISASSRKTFDWYRDLEQGALCSYYCFVAPVTEQLQLCAENLRRGFDSGIARGDRSLGEIGYLIGISSVACFIDHLVFTSMLKSLSLIRCIISGCPFSLARSYQFFLSKRNIIFESWNGTAIHM